MSYPFNQNLCLNIDLNVKTQFVLVCCVVCVCVVCVGVAWCSLQPPHPPPPGCGNLEIGLSRGRGQGQKGGGDPRRAPGFDYTHDGPSVRLDPEARGLQLLQLFWFQLIQRMRLIQLLRTRLHGTACRSLGTACPRSCSSRRPRSHGPVGLL